MALDDLELHALNLVVEKAIERHLEGGGGSKGEAERRRSDTEVEGCVVGKDLMLFVASELLPRRQLEPTRLLAETTRSSLPYVSGKAAAVAEIMIGSCT